MFSTKVIVRSFNSRFFCFPNLLYFIFSSRMFSQMGDMGSGAGKGGGSGGSIRDAGGAYGKMEAAREEEYFHKLVCFN